MILGGTSSRGRVCLGGVPPCFTSMTGIHAPPRVWGRHITRPRQQTFPATSSPANFEGQ